MGIIGRMLLENVAASALEKVIDKNEKEDNKRINKVSENYQYKMKINYSGEARPKSFNVLDDSGKALYKIKTRGIRKCEFSVYDCKNKGIVEVDEEYDKWAEMGRFYIRINEGEIKEYGEFEAAPDGISKESLLSYKYKNWRVKKESALAHQAYIYKGKETIGYFSISRKSPWCATIFYNDRANEIYCLSLYLGFKSCYESKTRGRFDI